MHRAGLRTLVRRLACFVPAVFAFSAAAQTTVRQVEIKSSWGGLGTPQSASLVIRRVPAGFVLNGKPVAPALVEALVAALKEPPVDGPSGWLSNDDAATAEKKNAGFARNLGRDLGLTPEWLAANAIPSALNDDASFDDAAPNQKELFVRSFSDMALIAQVLPGILFENHTDDHPKVSVSVEFEDGSRISAESHEQAMFMLPWKLEPAGQEAYNLHISRALSALMPEKTVNRDRLSGPWFGAGLAEAVMTHIDREWKQLDAENLAGGGMAAIRCVYAVESAETKRNPRHLYGDLWSTDQPGEMNLYATLRKPGFPPNLADSVVLASRGGKIEGVEEFLRSAGKYESLALSVPWLNEYMRAHPEVPVRIAYVHDASLGERAMSVFAADMHAKRKDASITEVEAARSSIVLLLAGEAARKSYWLLFPDKHMVLWRFDGPTGLLKWTANDFPLGRCSDYAPEEGGCAGTVVMPDGTLVPDRNDADEACVEAARSGREASPPPRGPLFPVYRDDSGGFIDQTGKVAIPLCFDSVGNFSEGLAPFERYRRWGFIDASGKVAIQPQFFEANAFSEGLARVKVTDDDDHGKGARWGFIDRNGRMVIQPEYETLDDANRTFRMLMMPGDETLNDADDEDAGFRNGLAMIEADRKRGFIDKTGKVVIKPQFRFKNRFHEGLVVATSGEELETWKWGYIDAVGSWAIRPQFEWAGPFSEHLAPVVLGRRCGFVNLNGEFVLQLPLQPGETDCNRVPGPFADGLSPWQPGEKYGFLDHRGRMAIKPRFDKAHGFSEGLAWVKLGGKWGCIDKRGRMAIKPRELKMLDEFHNGLAEVVTPDDAHGYIDRSGKYVWGPFQQDAD